jgi:DNA-directed RNA polymerase subunit K/omega
MVGQQVDALGAGQHPTDEARATGSLENRFLLSAIAFQRTKQLREGARARVLGADHKPTYLAVLEVLANTISWSRD